MHLTLGQTQLTDGQIDLLSKRLRQVVYVFALASMVILFRWIKIPRDQIYLFDVAREVNFWTWLNVGLLFAAGQSMLIAGWIRKAHRLPASGWTFAGVALLLLSLDDFISIHERLETFGEMLGGGSGFLRFAWVIPGFAVAGILVLIFWNAARSAHPVVRRDFLLGVGLFFGGALGMEMVSGAVLSTFGHHRPYTLLYHVEEVLEAVGIIFVLRAGLKDFVRVAGTRAGAA